MASPPASPPTPELAVADLTRAARMTVGQLLASLPEDVNYAGTEGWAVEVIDTRLTTGPTRDLDHGWVAYGTLRTTGLSPLIPPDQPFRGWVCDTKVGDLGRPS